MPERSFGRTVRYRRTKLGLSQAKLGELVGRSTATIRSWERDNSRPNDPKVLGALAAILGVDERHLFDKAEVEPPAVETSPTVEQALASLHPDGTPSIADLPAALPLEDEDPPSLDEQLLEVEDTPSAPHGVPVEEIDLGDLEDSGDESRDEPEDEPDPEPQRPVRQLVGVGATAPAYVAPPEPYIQTPPTPSLADASYMEDSSQRQMYRVRTLATMVALFALVVAFVWAVGEGMGALGEWWDSFFSGLRL